jgi:hypothetical protein
VSVEIVLSGFNIDSVSHLHELDDFRHKVLRDTCLNSNIPCM